MNSIKKSYWSECQTLIQNSSPEFHKLLSAVDPSDEMPIYIASYKYGETIGSKTKVFLPDSKSGTYLLGSSDTPNYIQRDLGYGMHSFPLGMIISNHCEWYYDDDDEIGTTYPFVIQGRGAIFNKHIVFQEDECVENSTLSVSSGSRSAFMLANIGSRINHDRLRESYDIQESPPKHHSEHFNIFKTITDNSNWHTTLLFFSKKWIDEIKKNQEWVHIKLYLSEQMREKQGRDLFNLSHNNLFMSAKKVNKFRPTPFLVDTAKIIFNIALNQGCAHSPAIDNSKLPLSEIQQVYREIYELKYNPTVMIPSTLNQADKIVYYSLQIPSTKINTFKIKLNNSTIKELDALKDILLSYISEFTDPQSRCYGSPLYNACLNVNFDFYHNAPTIKGIKISDELQSDSRFMFSTTPNGEFARDGKFFRGCIKIDLNN